MFLLSHICEVWKKFCDEFKNQCQVLCVNSSQESDEAVWSGCLPTRWRVLHKGSNELNFLTQTLSELFLISET